MSTPVLALRVNPQAVTAYCPCQRVCMCCTKQLQLTDTEGNSKQAHLYSRAQCCTKVAAGSWSSSHISTIAMPKLIISVPQHCKLPWAWVHTDKLSCSYSQSLLCQHYFGKLHFPEVHITDVPAHTLGELQRGFLTSKQEHRYTMSLTSPV